MGRTKAHSDGTTWKDVLDTVPEWENEHHIHITFELLFKPALTTGACVEVVIWERTATGRGNELCRVRQPFPARSASGHPGAVLRTMFAAVQELEANAWLWSTGKRRAVVDSPWGAPER